MSNLIILRHGEHDRMTGQLNPWEADRIWNLVAQLLASNNLTRGDIWILTSKKPRAIQTWNAILEHNPWTFIFEEWSDNITDWYPWKLDWTGKEVADFAELSKQTKILLEEIRVKLQQTKSWIILVWHEPSIIGLSNELSLQLTRDDLRRRQKLPLLTTLN